MSSLCFICDRLRLKRRNDSRRDFFKDFLRDIGVSDVPDKSIGQKQNIKCFSFNDALQFFFIWLYGIRHMVKDHSGSKRKKPAATTTWATLSNYQQWFFYMHHPTDWIAHTKAFVTPDVEHWLEWETMKDWSNNPSHHEQTLLPQRNKNKRWERWVSCTVCQFLLKWKKTFAWSIFLKQIYEICIQDNFPVVPLALHYINNIQYILIII